MKLFLVGGFLGSGKTTAIYNAVNWLHTGGKKTGVITNDQGEQQVDTNFFRFHQISVEEVSGGCFCCNLPDLKKTMRSLQKAGLPDAIFAESVGSCTDLVATVVNPLLHANPELEIVVSIFADIQVLVAWLSGNTNTFHDNVNYIYGKQLQEADILVVSKIDLLTTEQLQEAKHLIDRQFAHKKILYQNSMDNESIALWTETIFAYSRDPALRAALKVDYDIYAAGEAAMAWLDEEIGIQTPDRNAVSTGISFIEKIYTEINKQGYSIGHLKFLLNDGKRQQKISFTSFKQRTIKPQYKPLETDRVSILINARVQTDPALLRKVVSDAIDELEMSTGCKVIEKKISSFKPGYPKPSERISVYAG